MGKFSQNPNALITTVIFVIMCDNIYLYYLLCSLFCFISGEHIHIEGIWSFLTTLFAFLIPPLWFFLCLPIHRWNRVPMLKFICHLVSHLYFITVMVLVIVVPWDRSYLEVSMRAQKSEKC